MFLQQLKVDSSQISPYVLLPGDPGRVDIIGRKLSNFKIIGQTREFKTGIGRYKGIPITVCSTGIGCPSTAIAVEQLIKGEAKVLIRVGTCGGAWRRGIGAGSLVIATASIRDEGTTKEYIPSEFPAVADFDVVRALSSSVQKLGKRFFVGINRTHDAFYGSQESITRWGKYLLNEQWRNAETPILSSEMESAALFVIASLRGVKAGAIFAVNADPEPLRDRLMGKRQTVVSELSPQITQKTIENMIEIALDALHSLAK